MSAERAFLHRMLWRPSGGTAPEPVVALLGPRGAGKSTALQRLSRECGGTVVHARLDFAENPGLDPVAAVAFVAFLLMRGWTNLRRRPVFHRLGLCLLALNEELSTDHAVAEAQIKALLRQYAQRTPLGRIGQRIPDLLFDATQVAAAVSGIAGTPQGAAVAALNNQAKPVIAALLHGVSRVGLRDAMRWHRTVPEAEDAGAIDSLIQLSTVNRPHALKYVVRALLADINDFTRHHKPAAAKCGCVQSTEMRSANHDHAWLLLVDNAHTKTGRAFLSALVAEKSDRMEAGADDPLLVVAAAGQWDSAWSRRWREPWTAPSAAPEKGGVRLFSQATRADWARVAKPATGAGRAWYPVWLDPATDFAAQAGETHAGLVARLAAGHPQAVLDLNAQLAADGTAPVLTALDDDGVPLWERTVRACLPDALPGEVPWQTVPPAVAVTAYFGQPARDPDVPPPAALPGSAPIVRQLRANLWVSTFTNTPSPLGGIGREDGYPAAVHPWLARCLLAGLAEQTGEPPLWDGLFDRLHDAQAANGPSRHLFRDLARDRFSDVVAELVEMFDTIDHRAWVRVLDDVTHAPCRYPARETLEVTYRRLSPDHVPGRGAIEAAVTSLVALLWLLRDPLTVPGQRWLERIHSDFGRLAAGSGRADVSALEEASRQFES